MQVLDRIYKPPICIFTIIISCIGLLMLYSAAEGSIYPWCIKQGVRFLLGFSLMIGLSYVPIQFWYKSSYIFYFISLGLLFYVHTKGYIGMGAQRWIDLYFFSLQPSELARLSLLIVISRYFADNLPYIKRTSTLIWPIIFLLIPMFLIIKQPDLGTALVILFSILFLAYIAGVEIWKFLAMFFGFCISAPILWQFLHDYQKKRIFIFLNPELDSHKSGYHMMQSKIALGSGGIWGKGFLEGTQSHLQFLPENQTDFIFTMFAEEFGMFLSIGLFALYGGLIVSGYIVALNEKDRFSSLFIAGFTTSLFLYAFINIAMVMGIVPVVGVPLPLMSYGGTSLIILMIGQSIILSSYMQRLRI